MFIDNPVFPVVTEIMNHLRDIPVIQPALSEQKSRAGCYRAMGECEIFEPLNVEQYSVCVLLIHKRADYQTCHAIWSYFNEQSQKNDWITEPEWEAWPIAA